MRREDMGTWGHGDVSETTEKCFINNVKNSTK